MGQWLQMTFTVCKVQDKEARAVAKMGTLQNTRKAAIRLSEDKVSGFVF